MNKWSWEIKLTKWVSLSGGYYKGNSPISIGISSDFSRYEKHTDWWIVFEVSIWRFTLICISISDI